MSDHQSEFADGTGGKPDSLERALAVVRDGAGMDPSACAYPGAVMALARRARPPVIAAVGHAALTPVPQPMRPDHLFDAASLTKVVVTTTSLLKLYERGLFRLDDRLDGFFPETRVRPLGGATVRHLLTHASGLPGWLPLWELAPGRRDIVEALAAVPLDATPGARVEYSCAGFILLGRLVELIAGTGLAEFFAREIAAPLGMQDSRYLPLNRPIPAALTARLVPTERRSASARGAALTEAVRREGGGAGEWEERHPEGRARGIVHDENAAWLGGVAGNAGLFTTAGDLLAFGQMWLNEGIRGDRHVLDAATIGAATRNWTAGLGEDRGLGWQLPGPATAFDDLSSPASFGHTGFTGTGLWVIPGRGLVAVLLTNRLQFGRENEGIYRVRRSFLRALLG